MTTSGFDYNQWQAMNQQQLAASGTAEVDTPESVTQGGIDQLMQNAFRLLGLNPDFKGHGIASEANVGGGMSLQNTAIVKDRPGGVLASVLRYFTRELPHGLTGAEIDASGVPAPAHGEFSGPSGSSPEAFAPSPAMQDAVAAGRGLQVSAVVSVPIEHLGALTPPDTPDIARREIDMSRAA